VAAKEEVITMAKSRDERRHQLLDLQERFRRLSGHYQSEAIEIAGSNEKVEDSSAGNSSNEMADAATALYDQEMALTMRNRYRYRLTAIDEALTRWDQGTYGHCGVCNAAISETRLDLFPETPYCNQHAAMAEAIDDAAPVTDRPGWAA
jgi:RNA polymerase-binding transcription factor DksA